MQAACDYLPQEILGESPPCLAHSVQLVVYDSIDSQRTVIDTLAVGRNYVQFINKSKPARNLLFQLQREHGVRSPLNVVRCVEPRWDSELSMLERLVKLKPHASEVAEHDDFRNKCTLFTPNQWSLAKSLITVLSPVRVFTKFTQERPPRPGFASFKIARCENEVTSCTSPGLGTMKGELLTSYTDRLGQYKGSKPYIMSCMLDINIKGVTYNALEKTTAYDMVKQDVAAQIQQARPST